MAYQRETFYNSLADEWPHDTTYIERTCPKLERDQQALAEEALRQKKEREGAGFPYKSQSVQQCTWSRVRDTFGPESAGPLSNDNLYQGYVSTRPVLEKHIQTCLDILREVQGLKDLAKTKAPDAQRLFAECKALEGRWKVETALIDGQPFEQDLLQHVTKVNEEFSWVFKRLYKIRQQARRQEKHKHPSPPVDKYDIPESDIPTPLSTEGEPPPASFGDRLRRRLLGN